MVVGFKDGVMPKKIDLTKHKYGMLTVISETDKRDKYGYSYWLCLCDCGNYTEVQRKHLRTNKRPRSCGCLVKKHGMYGSREYRIWGGIMQRCTNQNNTNYNNYGGRGISVCERWHNFINFYNDIGIIPDGMSIDRIDNNKGYNPENCRIATAITQAQNKRILKKNTSGITGVYFDKSRHKWSVQITVDGKTKNLGRFADIFSAASARLSYENKIHYGCGL